MRKSAAKAVAAALILALSAAATPAQTEAAPAPGAAPVKGTARFDGRVYRADGKTPVENAIVRACYLQDGTSFSSKPTGATGEFEVAELPSGYADVVVETPQGVFVVNQVLQFVPGKRDSADLVLTLYSERPKEWWGSQEKRQVPCASGDSTGSADIRTSSSAGAFFTSGTGIAVLAGAGAVLLLLAASGGDDESSASPSQP